MNHARIDAPGFVACRCGGFMAVHLPAQPGVWDPGRLYRRHLDYHTARARRIRETRPFDGPSMVRVPISGDRL